MQLTNICRDVAEDARAGRRYLPAALCRWQPEDIAVPTPRIRADIRAAVATLLHRAEYLYASGRAGLGALPPAPPACRCGIFRQSIVASVRSSVKRDHDPLTGRVYVNGPRKLRLACGAVLGACLAGRGREPDPCARETCMPDVDVAILGGGCAGLSLAARLAPTRLSFRVVEPRRRYDDDRTWSFLAHGPRSVRGLRSRQLDALDGIRAGRGRAAGLAPVPLPIRRLRAFYDRALDLIDDARGGSIALGSTAGSVRPKDDGMWIETSDGGFSARHVCDARPPARRPAYSQFFVGREIVTAQATFDPDTVPFDAFQARLQHGYRFPLHSGPLPEIVPW